uniref:cell death abnormality protein 1-like n=1 Tax=Styela clava TaxID=7725 RepID=UPI0019395296|nr:cell death abnormality protein 1-like [Styela clava]
MLEATGSEVGAFGCFFVRCKGGKVCKSGKCVDKDPCSAKHCGTGKICRNGECVCNRGQEKNGKCVEDDDKCPAKPCSRDKICKRGKCVCESGIQFGSKCYGGVDKCKGVDCDHGRVCKNGKCICKYGYHEFGSKCVVCKDPKKFDDCATKCPPTCGDFHPYCIKSCDSSKYCVCPRGYVEHGNSCVKPDQCPGYCHGKICPPGYKCYGSKCVKSDPCYMVKCEKGKVCKDGKCVCAHGYEDFRGKCVKCHLPKVFNDCATNCPASCENLHPSCTKDCSRDRYCVCPKGKVLKTKSDNSYCVYPKECPRYACYNIECPKHSYCKDGKCICDENYVWKGDKCVDPCQWIKCGFGKECKWGKCVCKKGFNEFYGKCVQCFPPKVFKSCVTRCPASCENLYPFCTKDCSRDRYCVCPDGTVLKTKDDSSSCISPEECPRYCYGKICPHDHKCYDKKCVKSDPCKKVVCPDHSKCENGKCVCDERYQWKDHKCVAICFHPKIYKDCPTACPPTCDDLNPSFCTDNCRPGVNCICKHGYVEKSKTNNRCVRKESCPGYCDGKICAHEYKCYKDKCVPEDPCKNVECPDYSECKNGKCVCDRGYQRKHDKCVAICSHPKQYDECPTACPPSCDGSNTRFCTTVCRPGVNCVCKPGYVEKSKKDSRCTRKENCPRYCDGKICDYGYKCYKNKCVPDDPCYGIKCTPNSKCKYGKCVCFDGYIKKGDLCIDDPCHVIDCEPDRYCKLGKCVCRSGFIEHNDKCVKCNKPKVFDSCATRCPASCDDLRPRFCTTKCDYNKYCVCPEGYVQKSRKDDYCVRREHCPRYCDGRICAPGYECIDDECSRTDSCKNKDCPYHSKCVDGKCVCKDGYYLRRGRCVDLCRFRKCPDHSECKYGECECEHGYYMKRGKCYNDEKKCGWFSECPDNYYCKNNYCYCKDPHGKGCQDIIIIED